MVSGIQPDDPATIAAEIRRTALAAGLVLVIAGSSAGPQRLRGHGHRRAGGLAVRGVAVRPGHPALLGYARPGRGQASPVPVIGIPGYPLSAVVIFKLFARPLLAALQGWQPPEPVHQQAELACDWTSPPDAEHWVLVTLAPAGEHAGGALWPHRPAAAPGPSPGSMRADAWWRIPDRPGQRSAAVSSSTSSRSPAAPRVPGAARPGS